MSCLCCCTDDLKQEVDNLDKTRRSTDRFWLWLFAICWVGLIVLSAWSFTLGNPNRIIQGYDSFGNICGQKNRKIPGVPWSGMDMRDCPYVFHMNPANVSYTMKICVRKCADTSLEEDDLNNFEQRTGSMLYRYDYDRKNPQSYYKNFNPNTILSNRLRDEKLGFGPHPIFPVPKQRPVLNRCVGTDRIKLGNSFINNIYHYIKNMEVAHKIVSDIYTSYKNIALTVLFGVGVSLLVTFTIHFLASVVSFLIMVFSSLVLLALTGFSWFVYYDLSNQLHQIPAIEQLDDNIMNEKTFFAFSILLTIITVIILTISFFMRDRIQLMVALFNETATCLRSMPALVFQPIWTSAVLIIFLTLWTTVFMAIATAEDEIIYNATETRFKLSLPARSVIENNDGNVKFSSLADTYAIESVKHNLPKFIRYLLFFHIVMLFWSSEFILGCQQMTVASAVASWFFTRNKDEITCPIGKSIVRTTRYHLGSIALGSFLIVIFKIPRLIIAFLEYQLKKYKDQSGVVSCIFKCCQCFWYCMENFIRYINHNAYTIVAIEGEPYCSSAKVAFKTLTSNPLRILTLNTMGDFIIFLGKCVVTGSASIFAIYLMRGQTGLHYLAAPVLFASMITYLIAHSMLCVYEMVIDTMFLCFVEDINKNANSPEGFFAPDSLLKFAEEDIAQLKSRPIISQEMNVTKQPQSRNNGSGRQDPEEPPRPVGFVYPNLVESSH